MGCLPEPNYPDTPTLDFISFIVTEDNSAVLSLQFTDGDGDLGLSQADTLPPFCATCDHHFNLKCVRIDSQTLLFVSTK